MSKDKYKSRNEWKKLILTLSPTDFEQLCYDIVKLNNFKNVKFRGRGADGGRDLEAEYSFIIAKEDIREKFWFQCKRQQDGVSYKQISTEVQKAEDHGITKFFILSNTDTTPDCKSDIEKWNEKHRCRIIDRSGSSFLDLLFELPNVLTYYFPDEELPPIVTKKTPKELIRKTNEIGRFFDIRLKIKTDKKIDMTNFSEVADLLKESLLNLKNIDLNIKSLILQKISMLFYLMNRATDALMLLNKSLEITPKNVEALLNKGYILEKIDEIDESNECYDEIFEYEEENKFAFNNKAANLNRMGRFEEALVLINKALKIDPNFTIATINKVNALKGLKRFQEALKLIDEKKALLKKSISLKMVKVDLCIELLDFKEAYKINQEILKLEPDNLGALNNQGVIYEKNSKFQKRTKYLGLALKCFENLLDKNKDYPLGWLNKSAVLVSYQKIDEAERIIDSALQTFPKNPHILHKKGSILFHRKKYKDALKFIDKALKLIFKEEFLLNKAETQFCLKQYKSAKETIELYLKYNPTKSKAWYLKGKILKMLRKTSEANKCFEKAKELIESPISLLE